MTTHGKVAKTLWRTACAAMQCANNAVRDRRPLWWVRQERENAKVRVEQFFAQIEVMLIRNVPDTPGDIKRRPRETA